MWGVEVDCFCRCRHYLTYLSLTVGFIVRNIFIRYLITIDGLDEKSPVFVRTFAMPTVLETLGSCLA